MSDEEQLFDEKITEAKEEHVEDLETLKQVLAGEKEKTGKYLANWQRTQADFINYKRHAEQEKKETIEFANCRLILNLLTVIDDLERAFVSLPAENVESSWTEGIKLIYNKFKAILETEGLAEIKAKGEQFDPCLHEAVMCREGEEGIVIEEIQKGYRLKDRVIRPSKVIVGEGKQGKGNRPRNPEEE